MGCERRRVPPHPSRLACGEHLRMTAGGSLALSQPPIPSYTSPMDRDFLIELFAGFGPVTIRRMFSGYGVSADGVNFSLVLRGAVYLRADAATIPRFESEGSKPFQYEMKGKLRMIGSYWQLPERLYDDPDEMAEWARAAHAAAERAALAKRAKAKKVAKKKVTKTGVSTRVAQIKKAPQKKTPSS
jgi:DNA transformation protein